jgi:nitrite reductase (NADH) small subunit
MDKFVLLDEKEIPEGGSKIIRVEGKEIGVFRVDGSYYALLNWCSHQGGPACKGNIRGALFANAENGKLKFEWKKEGSVVVCPWHGLEYDITTGESLALRNQRLKKFSVSHVAGKIRIEL